MSLRISNRMCYFCSSFYCEICSYFLLTSTVRCLVRATCEIAFSAQCTVYKYVAPTRSKRTIRMFCLSRRLTNNKNKLNKSLLAINVLAAPTIFGCCASQITKKISFCNFYKLRHWSLFAFCRA